MTPRKELEAESVEESCLLAWSQAQGQLHFYTAQAHGLLPTVSWALLTSVSSQENAPQACVTASLMLGSSSVKVPLSQVCQVDN